MVWHHQGPSETHSRLRRRRRSTPGWINLHPRSLDACSSLPADRYNAWYSRGRTLVGLATSMSLWNEQSSSVSMPQVSGTTNVGRQLLRRCLLTGPPTSVCLSVCPVCRKKSTNAEINDCFLSGCVSKCVFMSLSLSFCLSVCPSVSVYLYLFVQVRLLCQKTTNYQD